MYANTQIRIGSAVVLATLITAGLTSCSDSLPDVTGARNRVDHALNSVDDAIAQLSKGVQTFDDIKKILQSTQNNLDSGEYKRQIEDVVGTVGNVAQLRVQGTVDFTRQRVIDDLLNIKHAIKGEPPEARIPVLSAANAPTVDFVSPARSAITIVGWNLDVAAKDRTNYPVTITNEKLGKRNYEPTARISFQGQYAVTIPVDSASPLKNDDLRISLEGYRQPFEISILNSKTPEPAEVFTELTIESHQVEDDKDPEGEVEFTILNDNAEVEHVIVGKNERWRNPGTVFVKFRASGVPPFVHNGDQYIFTDWKVSNPKPGKGTSGKLIVTKLHDNQGWNVFFVLKGTTNKGNALVLLNTQTVWYGKHDGGQSHPFDFKW